MVHYHFFKKKKKEVPRVGLADLGGASDGRRTKRVVSGTKDGFHCMEDSVHVTKDVSY